MTKYLECKFENSERPYTYKTEITGLVKGDKVLVTNKNGLRILTVERYVQSLPQTPKPVTWQWAIGTVHETSYEAMKVDGIGVSG